MKKTITEIKIEVKKITSLNKGNWKEEGKNRSRQRLSLRPATLLKKRLWHRCFHVNSAKFLRPPLLQNTSG